MAKPWLALSGPVIENKVMATPWLALSGPEMENRAMAWLNPGPVMENRQWLSSGYPFLDL